MPLPPRLSLSVLLLIVAAWLAACCVTLLVVLPMLRGSRRADEASEFMLEAARREAALNQLSEIRSPSGSRFFMTERARRELADALQDLVEVTTAIR